MSYEMTRPHVPYMVNNKFNGTKCNNCGNIRFPARTYCNKCQGTEFSQTLFETKGTIYQWSTTYKKKGQDTQRAFGTVIVPSEDGKDVIGVSCTFDVDDFNKLDIGKEVEMVPNDKYAIFKLVED